MRVEILIKQNYACVRWDAYSHHRIVCMNAGCGSQSTDFKDTLFHLVDVVGGTLRPLLADLTLSVSRRHLTRAQLGFEQRSLTAAHVHRIFAARVCVTMFLKRDYGCAPTMTSVWWSGTAQQVAAQVIEEGNADAGLNPVHNLVLVDALERMDARAMEEWLLVKSKTRSCTWSCMNYMQVHMRQLSYSHFQTTAAMVLYCRWGLDNPGVGCVVRG